MATEKRNIEANTLREEIFSLRVTVTGLRAGKGVLSECMNRYRESVLRIIDEQPTVDAVEVVHGRWKTYPDEYQICGAEFVCSNCNASFVNSELDSDNDFLEMMKFCPNCGADMRERKDND